MKNTRLIIVLSLLLFFGVANLTCSKKSASTPLNISGILYTDGLGNPITAYGDVSDDWGFSTTLSAREKELFNFTESVDMSATSVVANPKILPAYPNPARNYIGFIGQFGSDAEFTKLKVVVVDPFYNIALREAILVNGTSQIFLGLSNYTYQKNGIYRIYYSLSAKNNPNYKMGYGDFQICPGYISTPNCP